MDHTVQALKAAGEATRLRILAILSRHELSVSELVEVLGQSQPRVSRHLKILSDAQLVERHREGTSAYYRAAHRGRHAPLLHAIIASTDPADPDLQRDLERLNVIREARAAKAEAYFREIAADWDRMRKRHVPDADIEDALVEIVSAAPFADLIDLGTGTGRILEVLGRHAATGVGVDFSRDMLAVARDKLERAGLHNCHVQLGDVHTLDFPAGTFDVAVLHHVLHFLDDADKAIAEASRVLRPGGLLGGRRLRPAWADRAARRLRPRAPRVPTTTKWAPGSTRPASSNCKPATSPRISPPNPNPSPSPSGRPSNELMRRLPIHWRSPHDERPASFIRVLSAKHRQGRSSPFGARSMSFNRSHLSSCR